MPTKAEPKITSWSYSRWTTYRDCPRRFRYKFIDRLEEQQTPALARGEAVHKAAEKYLVCGGRLPKDLALFKTELRALRSAGALAEQQITFDSAWNSCAWNDWQNAWLRIKVDALQISDDGEQIRIIDFKTGRLREGVYDEQLELYGLGGLMQYPSAKCVVAELWYIDVGEIRPSASPAVFDRTEANALIDKWERRVRPMMADRSFKPRPGNACRYCHFRRSNGGPCEY